MRKESSEQVVGACDRRRHAIVEVPTRPSARGRWRWQRRRRTRKKRHAHCGEVEVSAARHPQVPCGLRRGADKVSLVLARSEGQDLARRINGKPSKARSVIEAQGAHNDNQRRIRLDYDQQDLDVFLNRFSESVPEMSLFRPRTRHVRARR